MAKHYIYKLFCVIHLNCNISMKLDGVDTRNRPSPCNLYTLTKPPDFPNPHFTSVVDYSGRVQWLSAAVSAQLFANF